MSDGRFSADHGSGVEHCQKSKSSISSCGDDVSHGSAGKFPPAAIYLAELRTCTYAVCKALCTVSVYLVPLHSVPTTDYPRMISCKSCIVSYDCDSANFFPCSQARQARTERHFVHLRSWSGACIIVGSKDSSAFPVGLPFQLRRRVITKRHQRCILIQLASITGIAPSSKIASITLY